MKFGGRIEEVNFLIVARTNCCEHPIIFLCHVGDQKIESEATILVIVLKWKFCLFLTFNNFFSQFILAAEWVSMNTFVIMF